MKKIFLLLTILVVGLYSCSKTDTSGNPPAITTPVLTTTAVSIITQFTAQAGGNVSSDGGDAVKARGICWSINPNPSTADLKTTDGTGTGNYSSVLPGLVPNTSYYVRAYATNSAGTAYGNELSFTTQQVSATSVTDIDGNIYQVITIGTQTWMKENLKTTRYQNGEAIPTGLGDASWGSTTSGAFAIYNNDAANNTVYGKLYNWYAGIDSRKIAPQGWHVPSLEEWETLIHSIGDYPVAGGALKESGFTHWITPNSGATNNSGFIALPAGGRLNDGTFTSLGIRCWWWTTTEAFGGADAEAILLVNDSPESIQVTGSKLTGASIRCIKD